MRRWRRHAARSFECTLGPSASLTRTVLIKPQQPGILIYPPTPPLFFFFLQQVCAAFPHIRPLHISLPLSLSPSPSAYQGAEAQSDAAAQRAQVPDPRLHRISEAEVGLLRQNVAAAPARGGEGRKTEGGEFNEEVKRVGSLSTRGANPSIERRTAASSPLGLSAEQK